MAIQSNKLTLPLIIGIPLLGLALTTLFYFFVTGYGIRLGTQNQGVLITPPKQITELRVLMPDGNPWVWNKGDGKWTFLVVGGASCDDLCRKKLYLVRQTHRALGKGALRVNTVYLDLDQALTAETAATMAAEYGNFQVVHANAEEASTWMSRQAPVLDIVHAANFYVVDPMGWVMMYYTDAHDYKAIIKDMKFLLKNS